MYFVSLQGYQPACIAHSSPSGITSFPVLSFIQISRRLGSWDRTSQRITCASISVCYCATGPIHVWFLYLRGIWFESASCFSEDRVLVGNARAMLQSRAGLILSHVKNLYSCITVLSCFGYFLHNVDCEPSEILPCIAHSFYLNFQAKSFPMISFITICGSLQTWDGTSPLKTYAGVIELCPFLFYKNHVGNLYLKGIQFESPNCLARIGFAKRTHEPRFEPVSHSRSRKELVQSVANVIFII